MQMFVSHQVRLFHFRFPPNRSLFVPFNSAVLSILISLYYLYSLLCVCNKISHISFSWKGQMWSRLACYTNIESSTRIVFFYRLYSIFCLFFLRLLIQGNKFCYANILYWYCLVWLGLAWIHSEMHHSLWSVRKHCHKYVLDMWTRLVTLRWRIIWIHKVC